MDRDEFDDEFDEFDEFGGEGYFDDEEGDVKEYEELAEYGVFDRVGLPGQVMGEGDLRSSDPIERFHIITRSIAAKLYLDHRDMEALENSFDKVKDPEYKNPLGYVLGYIASRGGTKIDNETVDKAFLSLEKDGDVKQPDVIRYARLWMKM